ncbi:MAG: hypothetical protein ABI665_19255 [Vicinamibacterales bacterium]
MRPIRVLLAAATAVALSGCINSATLIKVNPDGSGTVEQTTLVNMAALKSMMPGSNGQSANPINQAELKRTAERMGKGVKLVSAEPMTAGGFEGMKAIFSFDDINLVQVNQNPEMSGGTEPGMGERKESQDPVKFKFARQGGTSVLTIAFQDKPGTGKQADAPEPGGMPDLSNPMIMNMIKTMFDGFKINIAVEPVGTIVKTNAEYVTGSRITLLEMDMAALLADEAKFKALQGKLGPDASLSEVKPYLKDIKGIKVDGPIITIEFK